MHALSRLGLLLIITVLAGCASTPDQGEDISLWSAHKLYKEAKDSIRVQDYLSALDYLESLEGKYPFSPYTKQARLDLAYVHYLSGEAESAIAAADRFIKLHPQHPRVDYAYYLRGVALFEEYTGFFVEAFKQDPAHRDPGSARRAYGYLAELIQRFPKSEYAKDAEQRLVHLRNRLAKYEIFVAQYYLKRDANVAALNRGKYVLENYDQTPAVADALVVMIKAYRKMNMTKLADDAMRVLTLNAPHHPELLTLGNKKAR